MANAVAKQQITTLNLICRIGYLMFLQGFNAFTSLACFSGHAYIVAVATSLITAFMSLLLYRTLDKWKTP